MTTEREIIRKTEKMIDELKSVCSTYGLGNASSEYKIITEIFLYKYLNDKFIYETKKVAKELNENSNTKEVEKYLDSLSPEQFSILTMRMGANVAKIQNSYRVSTLFNNQNSTIPEFYELFDNALIGISNDNVDIFSVKTGSKEKIKLFDTLSQYITESDKRNAFFRAMISKLVEFSFENAFSEKYDFFATIFEYLIKDYNKDFGKYAEYYTPNSIARIIAKILAPNPTQNISLYDPAAGSGTLLLALAHQIGEENCTIYSQDISQKSNEFLRLNLILNNLVHSLGNVIHGDTLLNPAHLNKEKNGLAKFDYIVSNPPFKTDFSETRDQLADDKYKDRFFAGVPKIPVKKKESMPIYLLFLQHILYSLKDTGKAAIVVPTGFLTAINGIEPVIRKKVVHDNIIESVVIMPSDIFATTGANVSILFINKEKVNDGVFLVDASNLGIKEKQGNNNQKTILSQQEVEIIINAIVNKKEIANFSTLVSYDLIKEKNCNLSAKEYFKINVSFEKIEKKDIDLEINELLSGTEKFCKKYQENIKSAYDKINNEFLKTTFGNWETKKISEIAIVKAGGDKPKVFSKNITCECNVPIYSNGIEKDGLYGFTNKATVKENSITVSARGTIGFTKLRTKPFTPIVRLISITPNDQRFSKYIELFLQQYPFNSSGSIQKQLTVPQVKQIEIPIPPVELINKFNSSMEPLISNIELLEKSLLKNEQYLFDLMKYLMNK